MRKCLWMLLTVAISAGASAGALAGALAGAMSPLKLDLPLVGSLKPRDASEIRGSNWRLGCETLDRDFAKFEEYRDYIAPLGIKTVRLQCGWAKCEKVKGVYDFRWLDEIVDYLKARGVECALETDYGNPIYEGGGGRDLAGGFPTSETALEAWDRWVRALVEHFRDRVDIWMMWNEPDIGMPEKTPEMIAAFNVRTARIIRSVQPKARLAGLSIARMDVGRFRACLEAMGGDIGLFEWFVYHGYAEAPEESYPAVEAFKRVIADLGLKARLWQGENGCPSELTDRFALSAVSWTEYSQAKWDLRRMLGDLGHGVESSVFTICDFNHIGREINTKGLLRADEEGRVLAIKRAYYAVQNVASVFDDSVALVPGNERGFSIKDPSVATYEYRKGDVPLMVFWSQGEIVKADRKKGIDPVPGAHRSAVRLTRPGDSFETRPMVFSYRGDLSSLRDPVYLDLFSGLIYEFPRSNLVKSYGGWRILDVPVYDSPCLITDRSVLLSK